MNPISVERRGAIALATIDNPPVNAIGQAVRAGLVEAAEAIAADPEIKGALLLCAGRTFVAGADITEFDRPALAPTLRDSFAALEELDKPVVAVLHGTALGGGLELALSCHYRVIDPDGVVGFPEVSLGIIPGAGGTQRLPRLIGLAPALDLITTGKRVAARQALASGIVDAVTEGDRIEFALRFLQARLDAPPVRVSARAFPEVDPVALAAARAAVATAMPGQLAPCCAADVLADSAGLDFAAGELLEQAAFDALRVSPQSAALRHMFFAERAAGKVPGLGSPRPLRVIGVLGGGVAGAGLAAASLMSGFAVQLVERDEAALPAARGGVEANLREALDHGSLTDETLAAILGERFTASAEPHDLGEADLILEAVPDSAEAKQDAFGIINRIAGPHAVLATGTSVLDLSTIATALSRPANLIGLHFASSAPDAKLLEVVVPNGASLDAVATGFAFAKTLGKLAVRVGNREGLIGHRILSACFRAALVTVEDGASPWDVDAALRAFGFPLGPFEMQDRDGLDCSWPGSLPRTPTRDPAERSITFPDRIRARGWLGRKTGRGYYKYDNNGQEPNPEIDTIVADERRAKGIIPRPLPADAIQDRVALAAANAGVALLDEAVALRAGDIDVVMVNGYGFPRWRGGPMHALESRGLPAALSALTILARDDVVWRPAPLLIRSATAGMFE